MAEGFIDKMNGAPDADIAVFTQALGIPPEERDRYLDRACKGDIELRRRVEALLLAYEQSGDFLGRPAAGRPARAAQAFPAGEKPGDHALRVHSRLDNFQCDPPPDRFLLFGHVNHAASALTDLL